MTQANLPPELIDNIIGFIAIPRKLDNLYLDLSFRSSDEKRVKPDLYSCSLVCREWRELARPHIFHTVGLRCVLPLEEGPITLEAFLAFLDATPQVPLCIRKLDLTLIRTTTKRWYLHEEQPVSGVDHVVLHTVLNRLSRLHSLSLTGEHLFTSTLDDWAPTPIDIRHVHCNSTLGDVFPLLQLLGNVNELVVKSHHSFVNISYLARPAVALSHLKLRSLRLAAYSPIASFVEGILLSPVVNTLDSLSLMNFNTEDNCTALKRLLGRVGPRLLDIWIDASCILGKFFRTYQCAKID